eukprot:scaffold20381_cov75-Skeletonema_dohrnii-CCMP3373.AAC.2
MKEQKTRRRSCVEILELLIEKCLEAVRHADNSGYLSIHIAPGFCRLFIEAYPGSERISNERQWSASVPLRMHL